MSGEPLTPLRPRATVAELRAIVLDLGRVAVEARNEARALRIDLARLQGTVDEVLAELHSLAQRVDG
jgi:hypothetical protein